MVLYVLVEVYMIIIVVLTYLFMYVTHHCMLHVDQLEI